MMVNLFRKEFLVKLSLAIYLSLFIHIYLVLAAGWALAAVAIVQIPAWGIWVIWNQKESTLIGVCSITNFKKLHEWVEYKFICLYEENCGELYTFERMGTYRCQN